MTLCLSLPSVCRKVTRTLHVSPFFFFFLSLSFTHALPLFLSTHIVFLSLSFTSSTCLYVSVSPVLTPPESEKADSEDRVSLKVCSQQFLSSFSSFFLVKIHAVNPLQTLHPFLTAHEEHADNNLPLCYFLVFLFLSLDTPFFIRHRRE